MKSIRNSSLSEFTIEKSRFITRLFRIETTEEAKEIILSLRKEYADATHVVYAFITGSDSRSNDDGEPKGTAGLPTLEVLRKENMTNVLAVTIRYFGGIKLGAGGLLRAYVKGVSDCIKVSDITEERNVIDFELSISYRDSSYFDSKTDFKQVEKEYTDRVNYKITILKEELDSIKDLFIGFKDPYVFDIIGERVVFI